MTRVHLRTAQPLELMLHESDHEQLARAAAAAGYGVEEFARLALHRYSKATLAAPEPGDRFHGYRPLPICFNVSGGF